MATKAGESQLLSARPAHAVQSARHAERHTIIAGQLEIEGQRYFALSERVNGPPHALEQVPSDFLEKSRVGDLSINGRRYVVVLADNEAKQTAADPLDASVDVLTRRELQVVMLVAKGCVNKQIADQLKISEWTVSTHLRRIFAKLGVDSRAAMVYRWLEARLRTTAPADRRRPAPARE
jgi:DNA-binding CsgD family transcriptional regulator